MLINSIDPFIDNNIMLSAGKIYVVIGVILIIFIGLIIYLISMDRKVKRLEDEINKPKD